MMDGEELKRRYAAGERDFVGVDLIGADLRGVDLRGAILEQANLTEADLIPILINLATNN